MGSFFATFAVFRSAPLVASVALHAGLAAGFVVGFGGHRAQSSAPAAESADIDVSVATDPLPAVDPAPRPEPESAKPAAAALPPPTHRHDYPVPPSHDAHPHDPSIVHDHDAPPAPAAPAVTSDAVLPRFDLSVGSGAPVAAHVASQPGAGSGAGSAPMIEPTVPENAVSVPASLVARAVAAYPAAARASGLEADVPIEIVVDSSGAVVEARVLGQAGSGFDESALAAIRRYRFTAARRDGHPVRVRMKWSVQFRLQ